MMKKYKTKYQKYKHKYIKFKTYLSLAEGTITISPGKELKFVL